MEIPVFLCTFVHGAHWPDTPRLASSWDLFICIYYGATANDPLKAESLW